MGRSTELQVRLFAKSGPDFQGYATKTERGLLRGAACMNGAKLPRHSSMEKLWCH